MIFVGNRDGRKGIGLGIDVGGEMDENEFEEGEACSYQNGDDSTIDPDVALSYIDEKLQNVLGHFQKDFEGGVSAENLGAKFGGYGSFLPTYQRSPAWSHTRTSPKVHINNTPRSPNLLNVEGIHRNSVVSSSASVSATHGLAYVNAVSLPATRPSSGTDLVNQDVSMSSAWCAEEPITKCDFVNISSNPSDNKTLKVRIKVVSDNLSTRKNAEIYSGLGLDVSPSSSLDGSPLDNEWVLHEHQNGPDESPTSILQIMTSFPVHGSLLLSPLSDNLLKLRETGKVQGESRSGHAHKGSQHGSVKLVNNSNATRADREVSIERNPKSFDKNSSSNELKNGNTNNAQNGSGVLLKKEAEINTLDCEELDYNSLKLQLLSDSYCNVVDSGKGIAKAVGISKVANKRGMTEKSLSDLAEETPLEPVSTQQIGLVPNGNAGSDGKIKKSKKENSHDADASVYPRNEGNLKGEKSDISTKAGSNIYKGRKAHNTELIDPQKQKAGKKDIICEEGGMKLIPGREQSSSGAKKKSNGNLSHGAQGAEVPKIDSRFDSSAIKNGNDTQTNGHIPKSELEDFRKDHGKSRDRYKDFFGDLELEPKDDEMALEEMPPSEKLNDSDVVAKNTFIFNNTSKERLNGKKIDKPSTSEAHPKAASNVPAITGRGSISDAAHATVTPLVKEDWVCCDKCQKWRLLPLGTNPDSLPEKWLCSMLNWLPGMNRCSVSEEETTKALITHYQVPASASQSQTNQQANPGGVLLGVPWGGTQLFNQSHQNLGLDTAGKKKHGLKDESNSKDGTTQYSHSQKNILQASVKNRSLNGVNQFPSNELDVLHFGQSSSLERYKHKQKEKNKQLGNSSDGGDTNNLKTRNRREAETDFFKASKKIKTENDWRKYNDHSKDLKSSADENLQISVRNLGEQRQMASDYDMLHMEKYDGKDMVKKRRVDEFQETQIYPDSHPVAGHNLQGSRDFTEGMSENDHGKKKKARVSKSGGKETSISKGNGKNDKKGRRIKDQQLGPDLGSTQSQQSLDVADSFKRDLRSVQPALAATSSSSKVSGSHRNRANLQEVKGSPVESVSSSPLRISNQDKVTSLRRNLEGKDDSGDAGFFAAASNDGGNGSEIVRKDETFTVSHRGSLGSSVLDLHGRDLGHASVGKAKSEISSPEFATRHLSDGDADTFSHDTRYICKPNTSDQCCDGERENGNQYPANGSRSRKSTNGSSSRSKDKTQSFRSEFDHGEAKTLDFFNEQHMDHISSYEEKSKAGKNKLPEKFGVDSGKVEKNFVPKKDSSGRLFSESDRRESQSKFADSGVRMDPVSSQDLKQNLLLDHHSERSSKRFSSDQSERTEVSGRGKPHSLPPSGRGQIETVKRCPEPIPGSRKENGANILSHDVPEGDDALKVLKQIKKADNQNGNPPTNSRHPTPNGNRVRDVDAPSPLRRDSSSQAANNALKEAKDLKHLADRLKNSGSNLESTGYYFRAALKFLHGASLLESCNSDSTKRGEMIQSIQMYSSTAKLCEFCAHEYEKSKDMAAAALAYKCTEVAYTRVIYSSHTSASRDRNELQKALQIVPPGESPSSSASDVDNLNNPATLDKVSVAKGVSSPQVAGSHAITARNRSSFSRLLNFTQDVNFAMEASRKSLMAFAAAKSRLEEPQYREGIASVKMALDFNFQDVEGLLRMVRLAMEAISR